MESVWQMFKFSFLPCTMFNIVWKCILWYSLLVQTPAFCCLSSYLMSWDNILFVMLSNMLSKLNFVNPITFALYGVGTGKEVCSVFWLGCSKESWSHNSPAPRRNPVFSESSGEQWRSYWTTPKFALSWDLDRIHQQTAETGQASCVSVLITTVRQQDSNSMEHSPWETDSCPASWDVSYLLWNPKFHYHVHNSPPLDILSQLNLVHNFTLYVFNSHFNIIFSSIPSSSNGSLSFRFSM
jgi:hypothetical protein